MMLSTFLILNHNSGTRAMKTDFTRTGRRTLKGKLSDLYSSLSRYFLNNFYDGKRQDKIDLVLARFSPSSDSPKNSNVLSESSLPLKLFILLLVWIVALFTCSHRRIQGGCFVDSPKFVTRVVPLSSIMMVSSIGPNSLESKHDRADSNAHQNEILKIDKAV